ncbi:SGNH/GDSL hydrolase family protein [Amycolatopsis sp. GM8]|uniref:SGNH/GDSL hydrolase family protein n=1 Tax=Amycolatopsis sp. GM8 TaxID=2896530 RepID=UPI001F398D43|nr:SGNH/GDSL hydrolase family protein [Amycolatopsis sp. GM8]
MTPRRVRRLAVLGDSTAVGLGDPVPGRGWRGVGPFVGRALGIAPEGYLNTSFTGARMKSVRYEQLPAALAHRPDVALVIVGMNDTLRSDFDAPDMAADLDHIMSTLGAIGTVVVPVRFHDHGKVFRLPAPLYRALRGRIDELNAGIDNVVHHHGMPCLDLDAMPGAYDLAAWAVDRLHPSELGHRMLALGLSERIAEAGIEIVEPVSLECSGGIQPTTAQHVAWLLVKGLPWLWRRSTDLFPFIAKILAASAMESYVAWRDGTEIAGPEPQPSALQIR